MEKKREEYDKLSETEQENDQRNPVGRERNTFNPKYRGEKKRVMEKKKRKKKKNRKREERKHWKRE